VAFTWLCELSQKSLPSRDAAGLAGVGLLLLAGNPWIWWSVSFDYHAETLAILFAVLLARDLAHGRRRAWVWMLPLVACGDVAGTYLAGLGLGSVLVGPRLRRPGAVMACIGVAVTLIITLVHANKGSALNEYDYLATGATASSLGLAALVKGIIAHPLGAAQTIWAKRADVLANLAPAGLVGLCDLLVLPIVLVVIIANTLFAGVLFAEPIFQNLPVYILLPVGTIAVLTRLIRRSRRSALLLAGLLAAQALGWAMVWAPRTPSQWLRLSAPAAATLASIEARIPSAAEVIGSQGVIGGFAERRDQRPLTGAGTIPVARGQTWFVIVPSAGIETLSTASAMAFIGQLAGPLHATLVTHANGVWAFRWLPPSGVRTITVPGESTPLPAWTDPGPAGRAVLTGPVAGWHVSSDGREGYIAEGLAWQEPPGRYQALVTMSATGPVNVEVWNDTGNTLLARHSVPVTTGIESVLLPVDATTAYHARAYPGWGPFRADFAAPSPGERLEVRVWTPGGSTVNVYGAELVGGAGIASSRVPAREPGG
jgi:hypothetical protein